jgi:hypothetical protein
VLEFRLSGGAGNTNPNLSLGGVISSQNILTQTASFNSTPPTGITITRSVNNIYDTSGSSLSATLSVNTVSGQKKLYFSALGVVPFYAAQGDSNIATLISDGLYTLTWSENGLLASVTVSVVVSLVPAGPTTYKLNVVPPTKNALFDDTNPNQSFSESIDYRCIYLRNISSGPLSGILYFSKQPASAEFSLGLDPSGINGVAGTIATEVIAPVGVVFSRSFDNATGLQVSLPLNAHRAIWIKRKANLLFSSSVSFDDVTLALEI